MISATQQYFQLKFRGQFYSWSNLERKLSICLKSLTMFITYCCIEYTGGDRTTFEYIEVHQTAQ